jgi:hypothetical protein
MIPNLNCGTVSSLTFPQVDGSVRFGSEKIQNVLARVYKIILDYQNPPAAAGGSDPTSHTCEADNG